MTLDDLIQLTESEFENKVKPVVESEIPLMQFLRAYRRMKRVELKPWSGQIKHDLIFGDLRRSLQASGIRIRPYVDPDSSYEEDIRAYLSAVEDTVSDILQELLREDA